MHAGSIEVPCPRCGKPALVSPSKGLWCSHCRNDYAPLAFLSFDTLHLRMERDCPSDLAPAIAAYASTIQAQRGKPFQISAAGQTVILGTAASNN